MKYSFYNDYAEGAHLSILQALEQNNLEQAKGYGEDRFSNEAADLIRTIIQQPQAAVHFVSGGTQANLICLASMLKPFESVIAVTSGHINMHEAGAIEATGHKINAVPEVNGKIDPKEIKRVCAEHADEHMVQPRVVFISQATELGTVYSKQELEELSKTCKELNLFLYLDGARLGSALAAEGSDMSFADVARLVDAFYIGGTKNGALLGEAIVLVNPELQKQFRHHIKQRGGLLAKGRVIGIQFLELFKNNLYLELAQTANQRAAVLTAGIQQAGYQFLVESKTNQIFPILPHAVIEQLKENFGFYVWAKVDETQSAIRLVTSWATQTKAIEDFLRALKTA